MKAKLLFLAKVLFFSIILFALWESTVAKWYFLSFNYVLPFLSQLFFGEQRQLIVSTHFFPYIIAFIALVLSTPKVRLIRRITIILAGTTIFLIFGYLTVVSGITANAASRPGPLRTLYETTPLFLPFLFWIIFTHREVSDLFGIGTITSKIRGDRLCPICGKERAGMVDHIKASHGEKSLKTRKVKRFLSENPSVQI